MSKRLEKKVALVTGGASVLFPAAAARLDFAFAKSASNETRTRERTITCD